MRALLPLLLLLAACGAPADDAAPAQPPAATDSAAPSAPGENLFDPATVQVGDSVAGLRIDSLDVRQAADGQWVGRVRFAGQVRVRGTWEPHPDAEFRALCFFAAGEYAPRLPRFRSDVRRPWFCFEDQERARRLLKVPPERGRAEILIDGFTYHYAPTDVYNQARLVRVLTRVPQTQGAADSGG